MKKIVMITWAVLITGALLAPAGAQEQPPVQAQAGPAAPAAPRKRTARTKRVKKEQAKAPAAQAVPAPAVPVQVSTPATAAALPLPRVEVATAAPAAVSEAPKPAAFPRSSCPHCFQPLLAGYSGVISDLIPWMEAMDLQAAAFDHKLSAIQKQINEKENAIEQAKLDTDKKAMKAAVKNLNKEHKLLLKEYSAASDEKDAFYKKFSKEVEKRAERYNKITGSKLKETLSAASQ